MDYAVRMPKLTEEEEDQIDLPSCEAWFVEQVLESAATVIEQSDAEFAGRIWVTGAYENGLLLAAIGAVHGDGNDIEFYMPEVESLDDKLKILYLWFNSGFPPDKKRSALIREADWYDSSMEINIVLVAKAHDHKLHRSSWPGACDVAQDSGEPYLLVRGYQDNDVCRMVGDEKTVKMYLEAAAKRGLIADPYP